MLATGFIGSALVWQSRAMHRAREIALRAQLRSLRVSLAFFEARHGDRPKTLEVLETLGVPVIAFGQDEFPAFWSRSSGLPAPIRMDRAEDIADAHRLRTDMGLPGGQLVANPIPQADEVPPALLAPAIEIALSDAASNAIASKDVTPFLLQRVFELTDGRSLRANTALVLNNARLAANIARHFITH